MNLEKTRRKLPPQLDPRIQVGSHGYILGWILVWRNRSRARAELKQLVLWSPDSVLEDAGFSREEARREAGRPFWIPWGKA